MFYEFPKIEHINDVLPHIDDNFIVANKGEYTVINYILPDKETFPSVTDLRSAVRRECRGIIFCNVTGKILRRPLMKFFNAFERDEVSEDIVSNAMINNNYKVLDKRDGSFIAPFKTHSGRIIYGTKMGETHITPRVEEFVAANPLYGKFVEDYIDKKHTTVFEWTSPEDRIVIDYGEDPQLVLLAIRENNTGSFRAIDSRNAYLITVYPDIPVIKSYGNLPLNDIKAEQSTNTTDEGYVIRFDNGHMVKIKHEHYCKVHRAKSSLAKERHIVDLIINQKIDDLKPFLEPKEIQKLEDFEQSLHHKIGTLYNCFDSNMFIIQTKEISKKDLALKYKDITPAWLMALLFKFHGVVYDKEQVYAEIEKYILKYCTRDNKYQEFMVDGVLSDMLRWKPVMFSGDN